MQIALMNFRKKCRDSQKEVAGFLGISESAYRQKELGQSPLKADEVWLLAQRYGTKVEDIFLPSTVTKSENLQKHQTQDPST